jgi:transcriptional accessory protein Tex/SPT6
MQKFQAEQLTELKSKLESEMNGPATDGMEGGEHEPDQELIELTNRAIEMIRPLEDYEIERVRSAQSVEEFFDCYYHFQLHYGNDLQAMKENELKSKQNEKKKQTKSQKKAKKKRPKKKIIVDENGEEQEVDDEDADEDQDENEDEEDEEEDLEADETAADAETEAADSKLTKYASKKDRFHYCKLARLTSFAKKFGLTAEQLGENLESDYQKHEIEQWPGAVPSTIALDYVREPYFQTAEQVLSTVRYMIGIQMAREPRIRAHVRELYFQRAAVNVRPTMPRGFNEIDESHPCFTMKYLEKKPCNELKQDEFLRLVQAEQEGLLTIKFELVTNSSTTTTTTTTTTTAAAESSIGNEKQSSSQTGGNDDDNWDDDPAPAAAKTAPAPAKAATITTTTTTLTTRTINEKLKSFYQKDEFSYNVEQWNNERVKIIDEMLEKFLYVELERELRAKLLSEAKEYVFSECAKKLKAIVQTAPYDSGTTIDDDEERGVRIVSICFTTPETSEDNTDPSGGLSSADTLDSYSICACVSGEGQLEEFLTLRKLTVKLNRERGETLAALGDSTAADIAATKPYLHADKKQKIEDLQRLEEFLEQKKPHLIVVSGENKDALIIVDDLNEILKRLSSRNSLNTVNVELVDNEIGKLISCSKLCQADFIAGSNFNAPNSFLPSLVKQAITLARYVQDPLLCTAQLFNIDRDILSLKLHAQQQSIITLSGGSRNSEDSTRLLKLLEVQFINAANDVGVDLNRCNQQPHTSGVLQFVSGLGPRKSQHILKVLRQERLNLKAKLPQDKQLSSYPVVLNRLSLVTKCTLGRRVFINCAAFIKFDVDKIAKEIEEDDDEDSDSQRNDEANYTEILDSTRIHPETYEWARKMAIDALDFDENTEGANSTSAVKEILENPKRLKDLDLDAFAAELERTGHGNKITTLYDIRHELSSRYRERRAPYKSLSDDEKFYLLIKESPVTFYLGRLVTCRVVGIARRRPTKPELDDAPNPLKDENTCMWICQFCKRNDFNELHKVNLIESHLFSKW